MAITGAILFGFLLSLSAAFHYRSIQVSHAKNRYVRQYPGASTIQNSRILRASPGSRDDDDDEVDDGSDDGFVVQEVDNTINTKISTTSQLKLNDAIIKTITTEDLRHVKTSWFTSRIEIIVARNKRLNESATSQGDEDEYPTITQLEKAHRDLYTLLESIDQSIVNDYEIIIASPGLENELKSERDFISFQGFPVIVTTTELYKKKLSFEGTLQEKTSDNITISVKGRIVSIPWSIVGKVELPAPKFEPNDPEIKKLR